MYLLLLMRLHFFIFCLTVVSCTSGLGYMYIEELKSQPLV